MNVIIKPEMVYPKKYACRNCFQLVSIQSQHKYCSKLKTCWFCGRKKLKPGHWFDALMVGRYCPSALENHPAVEYRHKPCPSCHENIATVCCFRKHKANCNGKTRCKKCYQLIYAFRGEKLEDKVAAHQCNLRKCLLCYEDIKLEDMKSHCCKLARVTFPRGYL